MKLAEFLASGKQIHAGDVLESKNGGRLKVTRHSEWMWNDLGGTLQPMKASK